MLLLRPWNAFPPLSITTTFQLLLHPTNRFAQLQTMQASLAVTVSDCHDKGTLHGVTMLAHALYSYAISCCVVAGLLVRCCVIFEGILLRQRLAVNKQTYRGTSFNGYGWWHWHWGWGLLHCVVCCLIVSILWQHNLACLDATDVLLWQYNTTEWLGTC